MTASPVAAVVTSRLRRLVNPDEPWVLGLRGVLRKVWADRQTLLLGPTTAGFDFIWRAANRLNIPICLVEVPQSEPSDLGRPAVDRRVIDSADVVYALTLRSGGNLHTLLRERLQKRGGTVILIDLPGLQGRTARADLLDLGAQIWQPSADQCVAFPAELKPDDVTLERAAHRDVVLEVAPFPDHDGWEMLTHTTRSCPGPWPGETIEAYVDSLLESSATAEHSAISALRRILDQRRLISSARTIRGGSSVVSFTACPLHDLPSLHRFRPHRTRWDFEPFGICIRKQWLVDRGSRPVIYSDNASWSTLSPDDRPFFQLAGTDSVIDWSVEQEWRHLGDLDLSGLPTDDAVVFVPDLQMAKQLGPISPWPITFWPQASVIS